MSDTTLMAGYGPLDQADEIGIEEALVLEEVAASEFRTSATEVFRGLARRTSPDLSHDDIAGLSITFG